MPETHILLILWLLWQQWLYQERDPCAFPCVGTLSILKGTSSGCFVVCFLTRSYRNFEQNFTCSKRAKPLYVLLSTAGLNTTCTKKMQCHIFSLVSWSWTETSTATFLQLSVIMDEWNHHHQVHT